MLPPENRFFAFFSTRIIRGAVLLLMAETVLLPNTRYLPRYPELTFRIVYRLTIQAGNNSLTISCLVCQQQYRALMRLGEGGVLEQGIYMAIFLSGLPGTETKREKKIQSADRCQS